MPKKLLLADDSITIQKVIGITFANEDFALTTVDNGVDAIQTAKRIKPDLILADVVMPGKNGYEVCEYVKHDPELRGTPVLLLAGTFESFDEGEMARVGADGHITKPFESQTLIDKVHELTSRAQSPVPARPAAKAPAVPRPPARSVATPPSPARAEADESHSSFNLDDFSPFEEVAPADAPEATASEASAALDGQSGSGEEDVWDLSDFEPGAEGATAEDAEALFAEAEAAVDASGEGSDAGFAGVEGEQTFDFTESETAEPEPGAEADPFASADDAFAEGDGALAEEVLEPASEDEGFGSTDDGFGGNGDLAAGLMEATDSPSEASDDAMELTDFEEVTEAQEIEAVEEDPLAAAPEADQDDALVPAGAADGWQVEPVAQVRVPAGRPGAAPVAMGALATRVKAAAEGLAGELHAAGVSLPPGQIEAIVTRVARDVIEAVAWEVVPELCEQIITAEIRKITGGK